MSQPTLGAQCGPALAAQPLCASVAACKSGLGQLLESYKEAQRAQALMARPQNCAQEGRVSP